MTQDRLEPAWNRQGDALEFWGWLTEEDLDLLSGRRSREPRMNPERPQRRTWDVADEHLGTVPRTRGAHRRH